VIEKMATIIKHGIEGYDVETIYLCGGTCKLAGVDEVFGDICAIPAQRADNPMLITPLGIAMCCNTREPGTKLPTSC
jgi:ethanolamine utilization protein EutJ